MATGSNKRVNRSARSGFRLILPVPLARPVTRDVRHLEKVMAKKTSGILQRTEETLYTAMLGLKALESSDPRERMAGLRNLIVFGRAVTNVLQNLRSVEPEFESWYSSYGSEMSVDPLMRFFYTLR